MKGRNRIGAALAVAIVLLVLGGTVVLAPSARAQSTPSFLGGGTAYDITGSETAVTVFGLPSAAGGTIFVAAQIVCVGPNTPQKEPVSVTDSNGDSYASAGNYTPSWNAPLEAAFYYANTTGGTVSVTLSQPTCTTASYMAIAVGSYADLGTYLSSGSFGGETWDTYDVSTYVESTITTSVGNNLIAGFGLWQRSETSGAWPTPSSWTGFGVTSTADYPWAGEAYLFDAPNATTNVSLSGLSCCGALGAQYLPTLGIFAFLPPPPPASGGFMLSTDPPVTVDAILAALTVAGFVLVLWFYYTRDRKLE